MILSQSGKKKDVPVRGIMAAVIMLLFIMHTPMQMKYATKVAHRRRAEETSFISIVAAVKMHKWKEGVAEWQN